jgi:predicted Zn-dependent peptidase
MTTRTLLRSLLCIACAATPLIPVFADEAPLPADLPPYGDSRPLPVARIEEQTLDNGLTVWVVPRSGYPMVDVRLVVRGGTAVDPPGQLGLADVLADVLRGGTETRSSRQIAEDLQAVGGELRTSAGLDALVVAADGFSTDFETVLSIVADVARSSTFPASEVELAKANALQALQARMATPELEVDKQFAATVFGDHPYRFTSAEPETLQGLSREQLVREYRRRLRPERSLMIVAGPVDPAAAKAAVAASFGDWQAEGEAPAEVPAAPRSTERRILMIPRPGSVQSEIRVGRPSIPATDDDYIPVLVANTIFGGSFGSRLVDNIREDKGYTYSPGAGFDTFARGGMLRVRAAVRNEVTAASLLEIFYELDRMGSTLPTEQELAQAQRFQGGLYLLRNQIQGALVRTLANNWVQGLPVEALAEFVPKVEAVTAEDVKRVGREHFASRRQVVVLGGDADAIRADVELFGPVEVVE